MINLSVFSFLIVGCFYTAIKVSENLREPQVVRVYETDCFDHTRGKWKPDSNGVWRKVRK